MRQLVGPHLAARPGADVLIVADAPGSHTSRADSLRYLPDVLQLLTTTAFDPLAIPATVRPWDQAADAWLEPAIKLIIER